ncbi:MAG: extracellular solute-binding protein [Eubacteriales bacterium]|nr:extracellular solute-binding protein [Eubacteriales bacterium]
MKQKAVKGIKKIWALSLSAAMILAGGIPGETVMAEESSGIDHSEEITVTMMTTEAATQQFPSEGYIYDVIKEKFNINLVVDPIPASDYETKISTVLASGDLPDVLGGVTSEKIAQYVGTGMFLNLSDYQDIATDYFDLMYADDRVDETKKVEHDGSLYGFQKLEYYRVPIASMIALRMDLLEEQGIETPTTFEEYYDALLKIKEAHPEMYGFSSRNGTNYLIGAFAYAMGTGGFPLFQTTRGMYYEPNTDSYIYGPTSENFTRVVEFLRQAYEDGLLDPDYASMSKDDYFAKLSNGTMMSIYDNNSFIGRVYNVALAEIDENAYFDVLEPLENEDGEVRSYRYEKDWPNNNTVISSRTKYPERVVELFNWMYSEEGMMCTNFGEEGTDYTIADDGTIVTSQELLDAAEGASDVAAAVRGTLALGLQGMAQYVDESLDAQITNAIMLEQGEKVTQWTEEGKITFYPQWPPFTTEENSRITEIESNLNNLFNQSIDGFITGRTSMDEWDSFVESLKAQGSEELEQIFNDAYARLQ